jgi:putative acetyltransferase
MMSLLIRQEADSDRKSVFEVNERAFPMTAEAELVDALREGGFVRVSFVAEIEGRIVGHILFSDLPIITGQGTVPALSLAPMAVVPEYQRQGIGSELVRKGLEACKEQGHRVVVVLGWPQFYPRFGFSAELARTLESPFSGEHFMAVELVPGSLNGVVGRVEYPSPFGVFE